MKYEKEITIEVNITYEKLKEVLENNNFEIKEEYDLKDIYMINKNYPIDDNYLKLLNNCVLIRHIIDSEKELKMITYKYKEYNEKEEIIKQGKINCNIENIEDAYNLFNCLNYKELIRINDHLIVFANKNIELVVQLVNNKHIYIEMEDKCNYIDRYYKSENEMINDLKQYNIPIKDNNYFVKKAEIELKEKFNVSRETLN